MGYWILGFLDVVALVGLIALMKERKDLREKLKIVRRDIECLRAFFENYCPRELVKKVLASRARFVDEACNEQVRLQTGGWTPPFHIDRSNKEELSRAFSKDYSRQAEIVKMQLEAFWTRREIAILAASAARSNFNNFGVEPEKRSWKDFLPGAPDKAPLQSNKSSQDDGLHPAYKSGQFLL